jgi:hypothetical protein
MKKYMLASILIAAAVPALAQSPPSNSVTLNWTNPSAYLSGQALTIGQVSVFYDTTETSQSGPAITLTTPPLLPGTHTFTVSACDNLVPQTCGAMSNAATVTIPAVPLVVPAISNLTATVNP